MYQRQRCDTRDIELFYIVDVNLNLYKYFLAVIEERSVNRAAIRMGVSQPSVSYNIHMLQRELGVKLFLVARGGIVPTKQALILYRQIKPLYEDLVQTITAFSRRRE